MGFKIHIENGAQVLFSTITFKRTKLRLLMVAAPCLLVINSFNAQASGFSSANFSHTSFNHSAGKFLTLYRNAVRQAIDVSGTVTDENGVPLPGVAVRVVGTSLATATDANGRYQFNGVAEGATLTFKMLGFVAQEVTVTKSQMNISLKTDIQNLSEVVITDGYRITSLAANTSSISSIKGDVMENKPYSTFAQTLQGQIAGLVAPTTSGQPGANVDIRIRGLGSLSLSSSPLIVIDGMIVNSGKLGYNSTTANALAGLNQNDIESIDVLKDAGGDGIIWFPW